MPFGEDSVWDTFYSFVFIDVVSTATIGYTDAIEGA
jgi:hypothetical protein